MNISSDLNTFGKRLSYLRESNSINQQALSNATGISRSNLSKYEQDKVKPSSDAIVSICRFFQTPADWLLGLNNENNYLHSSDMKEMIAVLEYIMADPDPDLHAWAKIQFKKAFAEYYELLELDKSKHRSSTSTNTDEDAATTENSNIA